MLIPRSDMPLTTSITGHPRACLVVAILSFQLFLLFSSRLLPISIPLSSTARQRQPAGMATGDSTLCPLGLIYVYDLPPQFNRALVDACDDLNPWNSRCEAFSNSGLGVASVDLAGLIPAQLLPTWFATDQFAGELIFHHRILGHRCRSMKPSTASAFYVPFYAGFAVGKYLWSSVPNNTYTYEDRDRLCWQLLSWIANQPYWQRSGGRDHFLMLGRISWDFRRSKEEDWGGSFLYMPAMSNVTRLVIERNPWDELDVGVPYPTGFHPRTPSEVRIWQEHVLSRNRSTLFCFAGAARKKFRNDFRSLLLSQCAEEAPGRCRSLNCSGRRCANRNRETLGLFLESEFCLQPRGDSFTRRSIFDCMIAGGIPVLFWRRSAARQYEWYLPEDLSEFSVMIDREKVRNGSVTVRGVLEGIGEETRKRMREKVVELIPNLVYAQPEEGLGPEARDAFDVAVEGVLRRFREWQRIA